MRKSAIYKGEGITWFTQVIILWVNTILGLGTVVNRNPNPTRPDPVRPFSSPSSHSHRGLSSLITNGLDTLLLLLLLIFFLVIINGSCSSLSSSLSISNSIHYFSSLFTSSSPTLLLEEKGNRFHRPNPRLHRRWFEIWAAFNSLYFFFFIMLLLVPSHFYYPLAVWGYMCTEFYDPRFIWWFEMNSK